MRVAVVLEQALAPVPGGTGRYSLGLAAALARTADAHDSVASFCAWHRATVAAAVPGVLGPTRALLGRRALAVAYSRRTGPVPRHADIVHAPTLLAPPRRSRPLVVTVHDAVPWTHPETLTAHGAAWHQRMGASIAEEADAVVVPTSAVARQLGLALPSLDAQRIHVIGQGVTPALARPTAGPTPTVPGLPERYVLSLATLEPRKGLDVLLSALADPAAPDVPLVVVGQAGWGDVDVGASARALGLPPGRVIELGRLPDSQLAGVLAGAQALVMPSRAEGFGLPVIEAMAAGVPVVTSDDPALVEVGGGATLVSAREDPAALAEALSRLLGDVQLHASLRAAGLVRSRDFDWDDCARRLWALYASILDGPG